MSGRLTCQKTVGLEAEIIQMSEYPDITHALNTVCIKKAALTAQLCHHLVALEPKISPPIRGLLPHVRRSRGQHMPPHEAFKFAQGLKGYDRRRCAANFRFHSGVLICSEVTR